MVLRLSDHFTLDEFTKSSTADLHNIPNDPGWLEVENMKVLCRDILEPIRDHYGIPFSPLSGYRSLVLNNQVGSSPKSQHIRGQAVDISVASISNYELAVWVSDNLEFDQLILEENSADDPGSGWVHVSCLGKNRGEVLEFRNGSWTNGILDR